MEATRMSSKFQVVILKKSSRCLELSPGQTVQMVIYGNKIEMIPVRQIPKMRGFLEGIDTTAEREPERMSSF